MTVDGKPGPAHENEYDDQVVARLELLWGEGFLSPGGPGEVTEMLRALDLSGKRVLVSRGHFVASDWLQSDEGRGSSEMMQMSEALGLTFSLATPNETIAALNSAGFDNVAIRDRNPVYGEEAARELKRLEGPLREEAISLIGREKYEKWILARRLICQALDKDFLRLTHIFGQSP